MELIPVSRLALVTLLLAAGCTAEVGSGPDSNGGAGGNGASGAASGAGTAGSAGSSTTAGGIDLPGEPKYYRFVRLTSSQWENSTKDVLRLAQRSGLAANFQQTVAGTTDFANNELLLDVNQRAWSDYQTAAEQLADTVTSSDSALAAVYTGSDADGFIRSVGRRAYRRPLSDAEVASYTKLFQSGATLSGTSSNFAKGARLVLRALLQSPHFLYRTELVPDGAELDGYSLAAKLSLWLADTTPSDALLDGATMLATPEGRKQVATTLLSDARAVNVMREFHRELLHFDRYSQISKVGVPSYKESLNAEYEASAYAFFDGIFSKDLGLREILTSTRGFVGPGMAPLYGLPAMGSGLVEQDLGPRRTGYFAQLPYLTLHAFNDEPDSIHRGVSLNLDVLCAPLGPPAAVIPPVPPLQPNQTNRQRIATLTGGCGGVCHSAMINPLGFAFEHFDGMGQYRDSDNGLPVDSSGSYVFSEGEKTFADASELMRAMAESEQAHLCYAKKVASFGLQRDVVPADLDWLRTVAATSKTGAGSLKQLILALVETKAFRTHLRGTP